MSWFNGQKLTRWHRHWARFMVRIKVNRNSGLKKWKNQPSDRLAIVLHGGTGIPLEQIQKAISCGTSKINVNTENQIASAKTVREVLAADAELYDPRKYLGPARESIKETVKMKMREFGSSGKA